MCVACRVYRRLESIPTSHDEEEEKVAAELAELLGPERMPWLQLVHQLIVSEEAMQATFVLVGSNSQRQLILWALIIQDIDRAVRPAVIHI